MKLYIIGNGFDRTHGIESGYDDFENALWQIDPNMIVWSIEAEARLNEPEEFGHQSIATFYKSSNNLFCENTNSDFPDMRKAVWQYLWLGIIISL